MSDILVKDLHTGRQIREWALKAETRIAELEADNKNERANSHRFQKQLSEAWGKLDNVRRLRAKYGASKHMSNVLHKAWSKILVERDSLVADCAALRERLSTLASIAPHDITAIISEMRGAGHTVWADTLEDVGKANFLRQKLLDTRGQKEPRARNLDLAIERDRARINAEDECARLNTTLMDVEIDRDHWKSEFKLHHSCNKTEWDLRSERDSLVADCEVLQKVLYRTCDIAEAFLKYFNPSQLASAKEDQWLSLSDQLRRARQALVNHSGEKLLDNVADLPLSQQVGIRCQDDKFWQFLHLTRGPYNGGGAEDLVREICCEGHPLSLLDNTQEYAEKWKSLNAEYEQWIGLVGGE